MAPFTKASLDDYLEHTTAILTDTDGNLLLVLQDNTIVEILQDGDTDIYSLTPLEFFEC
jgi:hypothetical protein